LSTERRKREKTPRTSKTAIFATKVTVLLTYQITVIAILEFVIDQDQNLNLINQKFRRTKFL